MSEQEMEQVVEALQRYFDRARPDDDDFNAAISREDRERYGGQFLLIAPAVIIEGLRNAVMLQTVSFRDDEAADRELQILGLNLLIAYRSLVKAYGMGGVTALVTIGLNVSSDEDIVALIACALALLAEETSPMIKISLESAVASLKDEFNRRYGTGCKVALAYALLHLGVKGPFKTFAIPALAPREQQRAIERLLDSRGWEEQRLLDSLVLGSVMLDIASAGRVMLEWKRKP